MKKLVCFMVTALVLLTGFTFVSADEPVLYNVAYRKVPTVTGAAVETNVQKQEWRMVNGYKGTTSGHDFFQTKSTPANTPFEILFDLEATYPVEKIVMRGGNSAYPIDFEFLTSTDNATWTSFGAKAGHGSGYAETTLTHAAQNARYVKMAVTKCTTDPAISEIEIYSRKAPAANVALGKESTFEGTSVNGSNTPSYAVDGISSLLASNNDANLIVNQAQVTAAAGDAWSYRVSLGELYPVDKVVMVPGKSAAPKDYSVETSVDGLQWREAAAQSSGGGNFVPVTYRFESVLAKFIRINVRQSTGDNAAISELEVFRAENSEGNLPPVAENKSIVLFKNAAATQKLSVTDEDSASLLYAVAQQPGHGSLTDTSLNNGLFTYTYTPETGYAGPDSFRVDFTDRYGETSSTVVSVTVREGLPVQIQDFTVKNADHEEITETGLEGGMLSISYSVSNSLSQQKNIKVLGLLFKKTDDSAAALFRDDILLIPGQAYSNTQTVTISSDVSDYAFMLYCCDESLSSVSDGYLFDTEGSRLFAFGENTGDFDVEVRDGGITAFLETAGHAVFVVEKGGEVVLCGALTEADRQIALAMPLSAESGEYRLVIQSAAKPFYYSDLALRSEAVQKVNLAVAAKSADALSVALETYQKTVGIDWNGIGVILSRTRREQLCTSLKSSYLLPSEIQLDIDNFIVVKKIYHASTAEIAVLLRDNAESLGVELSIDYNTYQNDIADILSKNECESTAAFTVFFRGTVALAAFNGASRSNIETVISDYVGVLNLPPAFNNLTGGKRNTVLKILVDADFDSLEALRDRAGAEAEAAAKPEGGSGGGGGGSGGGRTAVTTITTPNVPLAPVEKIAPPEFADLSSAPWAKDAVMYLYEKNIVSGTGQNLFAPDENVTRGQFVKMLILAFAEVDKTATAAFDDLSEADWEYPYVATGEKLHLVNGTNGGRFEKDAVITRTDMVVLAYRFARYANRLGMVSHEPFADQALIPDYAAEAAASLAANGIISGVGNNEFAPKESCTRAMAAKIIYGILMKGGDGV